MRYNVFYSFRGIYLNSRIQLAQVLGGLFIGYVLDTPGLRRSQRARLGWMIAFIMTFSIYGGGYAFQKWADTKGKNFLDLADASECLFSILFFGRDLIVHANLSLSRGPLPFVHILWHVRCRFPESLLLGYGCPQQ